MPATTLLTPLRIENWGLLDYQQAFERQLHCQQQRLAGAAEDLLVLVEHPQTVTLGRRATTGELQTAEDDFPHHGVSLQRINRGGLATAHEPGQLVAYPILALKKKDLHWFSEGVLTAVIRLLADYQLTGVLKKGEPGVWVNGKKICSFGIALKKWVSSHGIALNVNNSLETFNLIVPCGVPGEIMTSLSRECGRPINMDELRQRFVEHFCHIFSYQADVTRL